MNEDHISLKLPWENKEESEEKEFTRFLGSGHGCVDSKVSLLGIYTYMPT